MRRLQTRGLAQSWRSAMTMNEMETSGELAVFAVMDLLCLLSQETIWRVEHADCYFERMPSRHT